MTLIVEDGTGKTTSESYCSVAQADAYHSVRSTASTWVDFDTDAKEAALRLATDYIQQLYAGRWVGRRCTDGQALDWPRYDADRPDSSSGYWLSTVVPDILVKGCAELALKAASAPLVVDLGRETVNERVDVISVTYAQGAERQTTYAAADLWIQPLLTGGSGDVINITRA